MSITKIITLLLIFPLLISLAACSNSKLEAEKKGLQSENETLKTKVQQLTDENNKLKGELEDLKQTDQYMFSKAKEHYDSSNIRDAKKLLDKLLMRFPNSIYKTQAAELLSEVNRRIAIADAIEKGESEINSTMSNQEFTKAWAALRSIKKYISADKYNELAKTIDEKQNKPINVSITELLADRRGYL